MSGPSNADVPQKPAAKCNHAWILNVKPAVCLWCKARKQPKRGRAPGAP
jgi:hypothetical protein